LGPAGARVARGQPRPRLIEAAPSTRSLRMAPIGVVKVVEADKTFVGQSANARLLHLKRYPAEVDFRYNEPTALGVNGSMRPEAVRTGILGKRLDAGCQRINETVGHGGRTGIPLAD
ncbi:MAG: hypothetical protein WA417_16225, partial [Stellaceae bacterium]